MTSPDREPRGLEVILEEFKPQKLNYEPKYEVLMFMCEIYDLTYKHQGGPNMQNRYSVPLIISLNLLQNIFPNQKNGLSKCWHFSLRLNV